MSNSDDIQASVAVYGALREDHAEALEAEEAEELALVRRSSFPTGAK